MQVKIENKADSTTLKKLTFDNISVGKMLAIQHALEVYQEHSEVAGDVCIALTNAMENVRGM